MRNWRVIVGILLVAGPVWAYYYYHVGALWATAYVGGLAAFYVGIALIIVGLSRYD